MESEILIRSQAHSTVTYHLSGSMLVQLRLISRHRIFIPYFCKTVSNLRLTLPSTIFSSGFELYTLPISFSFIFLPWRNSSSWPRPPLYRRFMITLRHITHGRTPLDEWSARHRDLYLTTHNTQPGGLRNHNSSKPAAADPRLRPQGHWDRLYFIGPS